MRTGLLFRGKGMAQLVLEEDDVTRGMEKQMEDVNHEDDDDDVDGDHDDSGDEDECYELDTSDVESGSDDDD